ncbi:MAG TPA: sigma 54-interacting transcriptional regulator [Polyangia bacterium]|nr:sigma 54-interacting transcriptional regulator [Polyangia bacterium]
MDVDTPFSRCEPSAAVVNTETLKDSHDRGRVPTLSMQWYVFVALEADRPLEGGARYALGGVDEVVIGRGAERTASRVATDGVRRLMLRLPGKSLSNIHARIIHSINGWTLEDAGSTNGCFVNGQRVQRALLAADDVIEVGHSFLMVGGFPLPLERSPTDRFARELGPSPRGFATLVPPLADQMDELEKISRTGVTVLVCGETGTGKELLARGIHELSQRKGPFLAVNCGALTDTLAESQLFGHVRGAFTGAVSDALGFVRAADGGTLLLDEVGDLGRPAQAALLRVLQEHEVVPVGSARTNKVDVRFIASSPHSLDVQVAEGDFRSDLLARLSGYTYLTTPLRQRRQDIALLIAAIFAKMGVAPHAEPRFTPEAALRLMLHPWPLNVRELEQALGRSWALSSGGVIEAAHLSLPGSGSTKPDSAPITPERMTLSPEEYDLRKRIVDELSSARGNVAEVARKLGKARMQLHRWMKRLAIDPESYRR